MTDDAERQSQNAVLAAVRTVAFGRDDRRVRAIWRVLFPWPLLWFLAGTIGVAVAAFVVPRGLSQPTNVAAFGLFQAAFSGVAVVAWAKYVDRRPLADYGLAVSREWVLDLCVGFGAVLVGHAVWLGTTATLGWTTVRAATPEPAPTLAYGLVALFVGVVVNVWVQETVFFGVTLQNGAEGLSNRGLSPSRAVVVAWAVAVLLFTLKHRPTTATGVLNYLLALGTFGILYAHTGQLALSVGVHTGVNYAGNALVGSASGAGGGTALVLASNSLSGVLGSLSDGAIPQILVAYLVILGWIGWRRDGVDLDPGIAGWTDRRSASSDD